VPDLSIGIEENLFAIGLHLLDALKFRLLDTGSEMDFVPPC
jgi:hypothetical protein